MYYLGILPVIKQDHQWIENYEEIFEIFKAINETQPDGFRDKTRQSGLRCFTGNEENVIIDYWMGMQQDWNKYKSLRWRSIYDPSVDLTDINLEVSDSKHNCVYNVGGRPAPDRYTLSGSPRLALSK